jgi:hypothetical protein
VKPVPPRPGAPAAGLTALLVSLVLAAPAARAHDDVAPTLRALEAQGVGTPGDALPWLRRADLARAAGDYAAATEALERAEAIDASSPSLALVRGALELDRGDHAAAASALARALAGGLSASELARAHLLSARVAAARSADAAALEAYDQALALAPHPHPDVALERVSYALSRGHRAEATAGLARARALLPHDRALAETAAALGEAGAPAVPRARAATAAAPAPPAIAGGPVLLPRGATWRYRADGAEPPGWTAPGYADSTWSSGPAPLGFGDPFIATSIPTGPDGSTRYWTSHFRIRFTVSDPPETFPGLWLLANYDDGFVAYLNGVEIARRSLPAGPITYSTPATLHEAGVYEAIDVSAAGMPAMVQGENVLAVEVHQATATSSDLAWDGELQQAQDVQAITRGPYLQRATPTELVMRWRTTFASDAKVWLGTDPAALVPSSGVSNVATEHVVPVGNLVPGTRYFYAVGSSDGQLAGGDSSFSFITPPLPGEVRPTRVWVLGDSGLPGPGQDRVRDAYREYTGAVPTDVWLMLGDNAYHSGTDAEYTAGLFTPYAEFLRGHCLWPIRGNHDFVYTGAGNDYYDHFTLPTQGEAGGLASSTEAWYAFDRGDVHFIGLDSEGSSLAPGSPMLTWLEADLAANELPWVIAFWHHPPYTKGSHDSDNPNDSFGKMRDMRQNVMPILEAHGVDLVLNGHSHSYERSYLLDGHHGTSGTLLPSMVLDAGDGSPAGDGAYLKPTSGTAPHEGEVVAVAGSSARIGGGTLDHPAMFRSLNVLGSMVIDIDQDELRAVFLDDLGVVRDSFVITKGTVLETPAPPLAGLALRVEGTHPARAGRPVRLAYTLPRDAHASLSIVDAAGRRVRALRGVATSAGTHAATWDGNDESGRRAPAGLYFALLDTDGARRTARIVLVP